MQFTSALPAPVGSIRNKSLPSSGLRHDLPYMKLDIWAPGEIERTFGHDTITFPNPDQLQHYATSGFSPAVVPTIEAMDSSMSIHVMPRQKAVQTSRPGFMNAPTELRHNDFLVVNTAESNEQGIEQAIRENISLVAAAENINSDPDTHAAIIRPGFMNAPTDFPHKDGALAISTKDSNQEGITHAIDNGITIKPGAQLINAEPEVFDPQPQQWSQPHEQICINFDEECPIYDGSIEGADAIENAADEIIEGLMCGDFNYDPHCMAPEIEPEIEPVEEPVIEEPVIEEPYSAG